MSALSRRRRRPRFVVHASTGEGKNMISNLCRLVRMEK